MGELIGPVTNLCWNLMTPFPPMVQWIRFDPLWCTKYSRSACRPCPNRPFDRKPAKHPSTIVVCMHSNFPLLRKLLSRLSYVKRGVFSRASLAKINKPASFHGFHPSSSTGANTICEKTLFVPIGLLSWHTYSPAAFLKNPPSAGSVKKISCKLVWIYITAAKSGHGVHDF